MRNSQEKIAHIAYCIWQSKEYLGIDSTADKNWQEAIYCLDNNIGVSEFMYKIYIMNNPWASGEVGS